MHVVLHIVGAVALVTAAIVLVVNEPQLRRRLHSFRAVQMPVLLGAAVLVPLNIVEAAVNSAGWRHTLTHGLTVACILYALVVAALTRIKTPRPPRPNASSLSVRTLTTWSWPAAARWRASPTPDTRCTPWS